MRDLKNEHKLDFLADLTAVDAGEEGFKGVYHVMSWQPYGMSRVEVPVPGTIPVYRPWRIFGRRPMCRNGRPIECSVSFMTAIPN